MPACSPGLRWLRELSQTALDVLAPRGCAACSAELQRGAAFCRSCQTQLCAARDAQIAGVPVLAGAAYGEIVANAIHRFKYGGRSDLAPALALLAQEALQRVGSTRSTLLVPVPLHRVRLAERGYNQSALLARELARHSGARVAPRALERLRATKQQARQDRNERRENVAGAFAVRHPRRVAGRRIVLIDDVVTTGATAADCIRALTRSDASVVAVVAVALAGSEQRR